MNSRAPAALFAFTALILGAAVGAAGMHLWTERGSEKEPAVHDEEKKHPAKKDDDEAAHESKREDAVALVQTVPAVEGEVSRRIEAFGVAAIPPTATTVVVWPGDLIVTAVLVQPGEHVDKDSPLLRMTITREAETQRLLAEQAVTSAARTLDVTQQRFDRGLATRADLVAAQSASDDAKRRFERVQLGVPPADGIIKAPSPGIVSAVRIQIGASVTAGTPLIDISLPDAVIAQLTLEPDNASAVQVGQVFQLRPLRKGDTAEYSARITIISPTLNPQSHLIEVVAAITSETHPIPGTLFRGTCALSPIKSVLIPRRALIPDGDEMFVYIVHDHTAKRTPVTPGLPSSDLIAIEKGCVAGDHVVVIGQGQLSDNAHVRESADSPDSKGDALGDR